MLRVKAKQPAYWKAESLDVFDGAALARVAGPARARRSTSSCPADPAVRERFTQRIKVNVRNLRTRTFVTAGIPIDAPEMPRPRGDPQRAARHLRLEPHAAPRRHLHGQRLHAAADREASCARRAPTTTATSTTTCTIDVLDPSCGRTARRAGRPGRGRCALPGVGPRGVPPDVVRRDFGDGARSSTSTASRSSRAPTSSAPGRSRSGSGAARDGPVDYVNVGRGLPRRRGFTYTEAPPAKSRTLEGFLFDAKTGYCQQYSGAMALLLRMRRHPRARGHRLHLRLLRPQGEGVRRARPRRPLVGRGVVPRPTAG